MISNEYKVKIIEINTKIGMNMSIESEIAKLLFNGSINKIVLPLLGEEGKNSTYTVKYINLSKPLKPQFNKIHSEKN